MKENDEGLLKAIVYALIVNTDLISGYSDESFEKIYKCIKMEHDARGLF